MTKPKRKTNWTLIILGALFLIGGGYAFFQNGQKEKGEEVELAKVELRTIKESVAASGRIFPVTEVKISSDVSGEVVELYIEEGDSVKMGKLLARIDPDSYQSQVERGMAGVNSAKAQVANAKSQVENLNAQKEQIMANLANVKQVHERNVQLKADGVISEAELQASDANLKGLEANLRSIQASIRASEQSVKAAEFGVESASATLIDLKTSLRRTDIYAPMSGIVSLLGVEKGERVVGTVQMAGTEMMRIADLSKMEVQVDVSENDIPRVSLNDMVEIDVDAYINRKFKGKVTEIAHSASNMQSASIMTTADQVTNFVVTISILPESYQDLVSPDKPFPFRPGMSASVEINTNTIKDVLSVPIQAVTTREFDKDGKPKDRADEEEEEDDEEESSSDPDDEDIREVVFTFDTETTNIVEVKTGIQDDEFIQVESGLTEGQEIVIGPYAAISRKLKDGSDVVKKEKNKKKKGFSISF